MARYLIVIGCALIAASISPAQSSQPNILLLIAEDMSARVGAFDDNVAVTPNLDALASQGVRFPSTFTTAGVCAPSRSALILGMHQTSVGTHNMRTSFYSESPYRTVPPAHAKAFPELLRRAGYYTYTSDKLDYQFSNVAPGSGPATIWDYEGNDPHWRRSPPGKPFFGMYHFQATHESGLFPARYESTNTNVGDSRVLPEQVLVPPYYPDTPTVRRTIAQQYNNIQIMDARIGQILQQLRDDGLADSTIVIWTTDHGDGLPRSKREIFDSGTKVPMIIRWPESLLPDGYQAGSNDEQLISFVDIGPTILSFAGIAAPENMHGHSFTESGGAPRRYVYAAKDRLDEFPNRERAVRGTRYRYIYSYNPGEPRAQHIAYRDQMDMMQELWRLLDENELDDAQKAWFLPQPEEALYDTLSDPYETHNLAGDPSHAAILDEMRTALASWQASVPDLGDVAEADLARQFWPAGEQPVTPAPKLVVTDDGVLNVTNPTAGASIAYRIGDGDWQLFSGPIPVQPNVVMTFFAVRYGWAASPEVEYRATY